MTANDLSNVDVWLADLDKDNLEAIVESVPTLVAEVRRLRAMLQCEWCQVEKVPRCACEYDPRD